MEEECNEDIRAERYKNRCNSMGSDERQYRSISYNDKMLKTFLSKDSKFHLLSWHSVSNYFLLLNICYRIEQLPEIHQLMVDDD
jgi:hypothetical protein